MEKKTIVVGNGNMTVASELQADDGQVLSDAGFNMNIISKFMDPTKTVSHEDIAAFRFGPLQRQNDESFEDYKSRQKAEKFMLTIRGKFGIKMNPAGTYVKAGKKKLGKKNRKALKRELSRSRKAMALALGVNRIQPMPS